MRVAEARALRLFLGVITRRAEGDLLLSQARREIGPVSDPVWWLIAGLVKWGCRGWINAAASGLALDAGADDVAGLGPECVPAERARAAAADALRAWLLTLLDDDD